MSSFPPIRSMADIEAIEREPLERQNDVWTVYELLARAAALHADKPAFQYLPHGSLEDTPEPITYRELLERTHRAANLFHSLGIGRTDVVAILLPIVPQNFTALLGAITAGIAFPVNWMLRSEQVAQLLNAARARVLVALGETPGFTIHEQALELRARVPSLVQVLQVRGVHGRTDQGADFDLQCARFDAARLSFERAADPQDVALYIHTGGTTGMPKIARLVHRAIAYKCWAYRILLDQQPSHCGFAAHPLFHIGGLVHHTASWLARGMTSIILGPMGFRSPNVIRDYWKLVERYRVTELGGVPTTLGALANVPVDADVTSLRPYTMTGSAGLPVRVSRHFQETLGVRILSNYGMTENTATISIPPRDGDPKFGSAGLRLPFTRIRTAVVNEQGRIERDCAAGEIGEILISGPGVIPGYLDASLNAKLFLEGGWLRTGDLGRLDGDGYLWVTGRAKDLIVRSGHNIDPRVIEDALMSHTAVELAAAVGKPDAYAGELPAAFVQLKPGASASADELQEFASARVPERAACPVEVVIVEAMPLTGVGKIFKPALRERVACEVYAAIATRIVPPALDPQVELAPHPVHGQQVTITLSPHENRTGVEQAIASAFGRFTCAFRVAWREQVESGRIATGG